MKLHITFLALLSLAIVSVDAMKRPAEIDESTLNKKIARQNFYNFEFVEKCQKAIASIDIKKLQQYLEEDRNNAPHTRHLSALLYKTMEIAPDIACLSLSDRATYCNTLTALLLKQGVTVCDKYGDILCKAINCRAPLATIQQLLHAGANPNGSVTGNYTAVTLAVSSSASDIEVLKLLLSYGGDPNKYTHQDDEWQRTNAFEEALRYCDTKSAKALLKYGARQVFFNNEDEQEISALSYAYLAPDNDMMELLLAYGAPLELDRAAGFQLGEDTRTDEENQNNMLTTMQQRLTPLAYCAGFKNDCEELKALIAQSRNDETFRTALLEDALMWATARGEQENAALLLQSQASPKKACKIIVPILGQLEQEETIRLSKYTPLFHTLVNALPAFIKIKSGDTKSDSTITKENFLGTLLARTLRRDNKPLINLFIPYQPAFEPSIAFINRNLGHILSEKKREYFMQLRDSLNKRSPLKEQILSRASLREHLEDSMDQLPMELRNRFFQQEAIDAQISKIRWIKNKFN
jgi:ankyrin repeat protein